MSASYMKFEEFASYYSQMESVTTPPAYVVLDSRDPDSSLSDPRFQIAALADYYLLAIPNRSFFQFDGDTTGNWQNHFFPAITYDVGQPTEAPGPSSQRARSLELGCHIQGLSADYSNALVLYKPLSFQNWNTTASTGDATATTHQLGGTYCPLQADGSLGAPITSITLDNGEGAILIKASSPTAPVATNDTYTTPENTTLTVGPACSPTTPTPAANPSPPPSSPARPTAPSPSTPTAPSATRPRLASTAPTLSPTATAMAPSRATPPPLP